jgi:hypothetical protein
MGVFFGATELGIEEGQGGRMKDLEKKKEEEEERRRRGRNESIFFCKKKSLKHTFGLKCVPLRELFLIYI